MRRKTTTIDIGKQYEEAQQRGLDRMAMDLLARQLNCLRKPEWIKWLLSQVAQK